MGRKTQTQCDTHEKDIGWLLTDTFEVMEPSEPSELRLGRLEKIHGKINALQRDQVLVQMSATFRVLLK